MPSENGQQLQLAIREAAEPLTAPPTPSTSAAHPTAPRTLEITRPTVLSTHRPPLSTSTNGGEKVPKAIKFPLKVRYPHPSLPLSLFPHHYDTGISYPSPCVSHVYPSIVHPPQHPSTPKKASGPSVLPVSNSISWARPRGVIVP